MRALVVFESMFGNTKAIAQAIADGLGAHGEVELVEVGSAPAQPGRDVDLVVLGGPTHAFSMSRTSTRRDAARRSTALVSRGIGVREWVEALGPASQAPGPGFACFDTKIRKPRLPGSAARAAQRRLRRDGYRIASPAVNFWVSGTIGPLNPGELNRARRWGDALGSSVGAVRLGTPAD